MDEFKPLTTGTVEERIQHRAERKLYLDQMVNRGRGSHSSTFQLNLSRI